MKKALDAVKKRACSHEILKRYEMLLHDRNTLLANLGVMGREFAQEIEEKDLITVPSYKILQSIAERDSYKEYVIADAVSLIAEQPSNGGADLAPSLLERLQADILFYIPQRSLPDLIEDGDRSIYSAITPTLFQEVELFYSYVRYKAPCGGARQIGSVIVLVPDLALYRDPFNSFFHHHQPLKIQFWDDSPSLNYDGGRRPLCEWLDLLLQLVRGEPSKEDEESAHAFSGRNAYLMKSFISHPLTLKAIGVRSDESFQETEHESSFFSLLDQLNLSWHISFDHAVRDLKRHGLTLSLEELASSGSFSQIKVDILDGIIGKRDISRVFPQGIDYEALNALLSCIGLLESLEKVWSIPASESDSKPIIEWVAALRASFNLLVMDHEILDEREIDLFEKSCQLFHTLHDRCPSVKMPIGWFHSAFVREMRRLTKSEIPSMWNAHIIVAERGQFDLIPCEGIALLGVSHDIFPEKSKEHFFSHLEVSSPKVTDDITIIDRSLFLESILLPSSWWYVSAYGLNPSESRSALSLFSPLVREVIRYIDINYRFADGRLFSESAVHIITSYAGSSLHSLWKKYEELFMKKQLPERPQTPIDRSVSSSHARLISELIQLGKSPLDLFLEAHLQVKSSQLYLLENHQKKRGGDALFASQYSMTEYMRQMLEGKKREDVEQIMVRRWPKGIPGSLTLQFCHDEYRHIIASLHGESLEEPPFHLTLFDYEFGRAEAGIKEHEYVRPAICLSEHEPLFLYGTIKHSSRKEMLLLSHKWEQELFSRFPEFLIRLAAFHLYGIGSNRYFAVRDKEGADVSLDLDSTLKLLSSWSRFYDEALEVPFPFSYTIVKALIAKCPLIEDEDERAGFLLQLIENESEYNTSLRILMPWFSYDYIKNSYELWQRAARELYLMFFHVLEQPKKIHSIHED